MWKDRLERKIRIGDRLVGPGERIFLTGEIGPAHGGSMKKARELVRCAAEGGCDGADIFMADPHKFFYKTLDSGRLDPFKAWEDLYLTDEQWRELIDYGKSLGLIVYPTPLDPISVERCRKLKVEMVNINSDDVNNYLLLEQIASLGVPVTMHDIDQSLAEVEGAIQTLMENGCKDIIVLHSTMETDEGDFAYDTANLNVMNTYRQAFGDLGVLAGVVEHTTSDYLIYAVAAMQPALISKHIKYDDEVEADAGIAVKIDDLKLMNSRIRRIERALGNGHNQRVVDEDGTPRQRSRNKVLVANRDIKAGTIITRDDIIAKRPGDRNGLHPWFAKVLIGAKALHDIKEDTLIHMADFSDIQDPGYKFPEVNGYRLASGHKSMGA